MTGFAEGFASGYGLMDATLQHQDEKKLKQQILDNENAHYADTSAREDRRDRASTDQFEKNYGLRAAEQKATATHLINADNVSQQNADSIEQSRKDTASYQQGSLGIQAMNARSNAAKDAAAINASNIQVKKDNLAMAQAIKEQEAKDARQYLFANHVDANGQLTNLPTTKEGSEKFIKAIDSGFGIDAHSIYKAPVESYKAVQTLQNSFKNHDGGEINAENDPDAINAINAIYGKQINNEIGKDTLKGTIVKKSPYSIVPHDVAPTPDNPTGKVYSIGVKTTYKRDGKEYTDSTPQPITQFRSDDKNLDPNARYFTPNQLLASINGHAAAVDFIASPQLKPVFEAAAARNKPKTENGDYKVVESQQISPDGMTIYKTPTGIIDQDTGRVTAYPSDKTGSSNKPEIRYNENGEAFTKDANGNVIPYKP